jgi:hypothetical protein
MGAFWRRLLGCERRTERYLRIILDLQAQITSLEQQLSDLRSTL